MKVEAKEVAWPARNNASGICFICGTGLGHYDSKLVHPDDGRVCCPDHLAEQDRWHRLHAPTCERLRGFRYWTDG